MSTIHPLDAGMLETLRQEALRGNAAAAESYLLMRYHLKGAISAEDAKSEDLLSLLQSLEQRALKQESGAAIAFVMAEDYVLNHKKS